MFRALHHGPDILVLPNAWDAASARIFEDAGFPAIATSSAGVAYALGYADGQQIPRHEMVEAVARIVRAVDLPVTADMEAGYGDPIETAREVAQAGAVGMNFEDAAGDSSLTPVPKQAAHIRAIRDAADLVLNARTDVFLLGIGEQETRVDRAIERLNAYLHAGADCAFAPGVRDVETIGHLARSVRGPLNVLGVAGTPPVEELQRLGVARVSVGSGPMRSVLAMTRRMAKELRDCGTFEVFREAIPYAEMNDLMRGRLARRAAEESAS